MNIASWKSILVYFLCCLWMTVVNADEPRSHVLVVSIDGLRPEIYLDPEKSGVMVENMTRLRQRGIYADRVLSVFPSVTYPAHTTMVTGSSPERHKVSSNFYPGTVEWLSRSSDIHTTTLWQVAKRAGMTTAAVMWPMTDGAEVDWLVVEKSKARSHAAGMRTALREGSSGGLLERLEARTGQSLPPSGPVSVRRMDQLATAYTAQILQDHKPDLTLVHFLEADHVQHRFGPDSIEAARAFERIDGHIGHLLAALQAAGIAERSNVIIVGDHGFSAVHTAININSLLHEMGYAAVNSPAPASEADQRGQDAAQTSDLVRFDSQAGSGAFFPKPGAGPERLAEFTRDLEALINRRYRPLLNFVSQQQLRELGAYPGAIAAVSAAPGYMVMAMPGLDVMHATHQYQGMHGYLPEMPEMITGLVAAGPDFRNGVRLPILRLLDLAPTIAEILGLDLPDAEGQVIAGALERPADPSVPL